MRHNENVEPYKPQPDTTVLPLTRNLQETLPLRPRTTSRRSSAITGSLPPSVVLQTHVPQDSPVPYSHQSYLAWRSQSSTLGSTVAPVSPALASSNQRRTSPSDNCAMLLSGFDPGPVPIHSPYSAVRQTATLITSNTSSPQANDLRYAEPAYGDRGNVPSLPPGLEEASLRFTDEAGSRYWTVANEMNRCGGPLSHISWQGRAGYSANQREATSTSVDGSLPRRFEEPSDPGTNTEPPESPRLRAFSLSLTPSGTSNTEPPESPRLHAFAGDFEEDGPEEDELEDDEIEYCEPTALSVLQIPSQRRSVSIGLSKASLRKLEILRHTKSFSLRGVRFPGHPPSPLGPHWDEFHGRA